MNKQLLLILLLSTPVITNYAMEDNTEIEMQEYKNGVFQPLQKPFRTLKSCSCRSIAEAERKEKQEKRIEFILTIVAAAAKGIAKGLLHSHF